MNCFQRLPLAFLASMFGGPPGGWHTAMGLRVLLSAARLLGMLGARTLACARTMIQLGVIQKHSYSVLEFL